MAELTLGTSELVGQGFCSRVYSWGQGRVLKVFHGRLARERADREYATTRAIHALGFPTPAAFELLEVEGHAAIVFERIQGVSVLGYTQSRPWAIFRAVGMLAKLHARIHSYTAPPGLQSLRERVSAGIDASDASAEEKQAAQSQLAALPDGTALCHGDFHPDNVLLTPNGPVVIDWSAASRGDPYGDVACTSHLLQTASLPPWSPSYAHLLLQLLRPLLHRSYLNGYLRLTGGTQQQIKAWQLPLAVFARSSRTGVMPE